MKLDRPLNVGAIGGHGPIRYTVESFKPDFHIWFQFIELKGFLGTHRFDIEAMEGEKSGLRHNIEMRLQGMARLI